MVLMVTKRLSAISRAVEGESMETSLGVKVILGWQRGRLKRLRVTHWLEREHGGGTKRALVPGLECL